MIMRDYIQRFFYQAPTTAEERARIEEFVAELRELARGVTIDTTPPDRPTTPAAEPEMILMIVKSKN